MIYCVILAPIGGFVVKLRRSPETGKANGGREVAGSGKMVCGERTEVGKRPVGRKRKRKKDQGGQKGI